MFEKYRMYCIVNQYIAGIHAGIQSAHAIADLLVKYDGKGSTNAQVLARTWATEDKTIIVLDGGYQSNLLRFCELADRIPSLPYAAFREEDAALNGAMTAVAIVLPEYMYSPQYMDSSQMWAINSTDSRPPLVGSQVANEYRDALTGKVTHRYNMYEKDLISAVKALKLKGA